MDAAPHQQQDQDRVPEQPTLPRTILAAGRHYTEHAVFREKRDGHYQDITWSEFENDLYALARGLLRLGFSAEDRAAIMAPNGSAWVLADLAVQCCRGISVPVYHTESLSSILYILKDAGCHQLFAWSSLVVGELLHHLDELPDLETIILLSGQLDDDRVITLSDLMTEPELELDTQLSRRLGSAEADDLASIVYTSGTTGPPKGAMLTHENFLSNVRACSQRYDISPHDTCLSFLPLSHVFERMCGYYLMLHQGATIAYAESIDSVPANMLEIRPTMMISVPRLYEKMYARVMERVGAGSWVKHKLFFMALDLCLRRLALEQAGIPVSGSLRKITDLAREKIFSKLREPLGGHLRFFVSGGAPLVRKVAEFFLAAGIPIYEGYGLTETSPVIACNYAGHLRLGTVGQPLPNTRVKIAVDGEILVTGPGVFKGYWQKPEQSREAMRDGWFHTGDIGTLDTDGYLAITDRKKDLIVTAGGENIAPQVLEKHLKTDKYIANAMVYGDRKPYLTALLVPNFDNLTRYANLQKIDFLTLCDLVNHPQILELVRRRIERLQGELPDIQQIKRFTLLSRDFSAEGGEITPTLKIRRKVVSHKFHKILEGMYQAQDQGIHDAGFCIIDNTMDT